MPISLSLFKPNQVAVQANPSAVGGREIEVDADGHSWWTNRLCHAWKDSQTPELGFQRVVVLFVRDCRRGSTMFFKAARSQQNTLHHILARRILTAITCSSELESSAIVPIEFRGARNYKCLVVWWMPRYICFLVTSIFLNLIVGRTSHFFISVCFHVSAGKILTECSIF
jgi:hypothetical protein